jgi:hypothetical protein
MQDAGDRRWYGAVTQESREVMSDVPARPTAQRGEVNIMRELSFAELDTERTELLPTRETLTFGNYNWANIVANNSSMALNAASVYAVANSAAGQTINVFQG